MKKATTILMSATVALAAAFVPIEFNLSATTVEGLVDISTCSAFFDNCSFDLTKECASTNGGWVEYYCNASPGPFGEGQPCGPGAPE